MTASSFIGSTYYDMTSTGVGITMDNTSYTLPLPTCVDDAANVGWGTPRNDGVYKNDTGSEQVIDGIVLMSVDIVSGSDQVACIPMISSDDITYTEVSTDFQVVASFNQSNRPIYMEYSLTVPNGSYVGIGFKNLDTTVNGTRYCFYHFARSRDGGDSPTLQGLTTTVLDNNNVTIALATIGLMHEVTGLTTVSQANKTSGLTDNLDGSFTNDTGGTLVVDGLILASALAVTASNMYSLSAGIDTGGGLAEIATAAAGGTRLGTSTFLPIYAAYTVSMDDGDTIKPMVTCLTSATNDIKIAGLQHFIRSRT